MTSFDPKLTLQEQPDELLLALTLYGEARGETALGKRAVAWVVRNRRELAEAWLAKRGRAHPLFGNGTIAGVVLRPWQFSCWNKGDPNLHKLMDIVQSDGASVHGGLWGVLKAVAKGVLEGEWDDPTFGATHYCTVALWGADKDGAWHGQAEIEAGRTKETVQIGNHVFAKVA